MVTIIAAIAFPIIILLGVFLIFQLRKLSQNIREHNEFIKKLDAQLYKDLRETQFKAREISKQARKYTDKKYSILSEIVSTILITILPFKKLKNIIYLHKIGKKVMR